MMMQILDKDHPDVYKAFKSGFNVVRRSERYWARLSTALATKQVLMRSVKTAVGFTRRRYIGESQIVLWLLTMPSCAEVNQAIQEVSCVGFYTCKKHKEKTKARQERYQRYILTIIDAMKDRSPFALYTNLRNIETGLVADNSVKADNAKEWEIK